MNDKDIRYEAIDDGDVLATHPTISLYGIGRTQAEALADFKDMLQGAFDEYRLTEDDLSWHLRAEFNEIRTLMIEWGML